MKSSIFIPSKICVGYQNRSDTYTKKLAYVVYYDNSNKLRKETSFESWRDKKIPKDDFENIPTSGFVLNKNVGGYKVDWNMRKSYIRVYDPRGFEFEIGLENLLYILENASSIKGKGLEGEFVYGWDGKDLVLIPTESPDYDTIKNFNDILKEKKTIKAKDLKPGFVYCDKNNNELVYMGRFMTYVTRAQYYHGSNFDGSIKEGSNDYIFAQKRHGSYDFHIKNKISGFLIKELYESLEFSEIFDQLEKQAFYSPITERKTCFYTVEEVKKFFEKDKYWWNVDVLKSEKFESYDITLNGVMIRAENRKYDDYWNRPKPLLFENFEEMFQTMRPIYFEWYLQNGNLFKTSKKELFNEE